MWWLRGTAAAVLAWLLRDDYPDGAELGDWT